MIPLLAVGIVWLVATNVFAILMMIGGSLPELAFVAAYAYTAFICAIPVSAIVLTVLQHLAYDR